MAIKAVFPEGKTSVTVNDLTQWDFGQVLEVQSPDISGVVEVHFAYKDKKEAIVRSSSVIDGVVTVPIPDICLEQTSTIVAWVYEIADGGGKTVLTVTMPIVTRTRPEPCEALPPEIEDKYTEALTAMNALVDEFENVENVVSSAIVNVNAAGNAALTNITTATQGGVASVNAAAQESVSKITNGELVAAKAVEAETAEKAKLVVTGDGVIAFPQMPQPNLTTATLTREGYYCAIVTPGSLIYQSLGVFYWRKGFETYTFATPKGYYLVIDSDGVVHRRLNGESGDATGITFAIELVWEV